MQSCENSLKSLIWRLPRHAGDKKSRTSLTQNIRAALSSSLTTASLETFLIKGSFMLLHVPAQEWQRHVSRLLMHVDYNHSFLKTLIVFASKQIIFPINSLANRKSDCRLCPDPVDRCLHLTFSGTAQLENLLLGPLKPPASIHSHTIRPSAFHRLRQPRESPVEYLATASPCRGLFIG